MRIIFKKKPMENYQSASRVARSPTHTSNTSLLHVTLSLITQVDNRSKSTHNPFHIRRLETVSSYSSINQASSYRRRLSGRVTPLHEEVGSKTWTTTTTTHHYLQPYLLLIKSKNHCYWQILRTQLNVF